MCWRVVVATQTDKGLNGPWTDLYHNRVVIFSGSSALAYFICIHNHIHIYIVLSWPINYLLDQQQPVSFTTTKKREEELTAGNWN